MVTGQGVIQRQRSILPVMRELLQGGANIHETSLLNSKSKGMTAIQIATDRGIETTFVSTLLQSGAGRACFHANLVSFL